MKTNKFRWLIFVIITCGFAFYFLTIDTKDNKTESSKEQIHSLPANELDLQMNDGDSEPYEKVGSNCQSGELNKQIFSNFDLKDNSQFFAEEKTWKIFQIDKQTGFRDYDIVLIQAKNNENESVAGLVIRKPDTKKIENLACYTTFLYESDKSISLFNVNFAISQSEFAIALIESTRENEDPSLNDEITEKYINLIKPNFQNKSFDEILFVKIYGNYTDSECSSDRSATLVQTSNTSLNYVDLKLQISDSLQKLDPTKNRESTAACNAYSRELEIVYRWDGKEYRTESDIPELTEGWPN